MKTMKTIAVTVIILFLYTLSGVSQQRDHFVFSQLKYRGGNWNMYPSSFAEIINLLMTTTSVKSELRRNDISLTDKNLFISPFMWMVGDRGFDKFTEKEIKILRQYLVCGGLIVIDDAIGHRNHGFDKSVRKLIKDLFPGSKLEKIPDDHAIFREGLRAILDRQKDIVVIGEARDGVEPSNLLWRGVLAPISWPNHLWTGRGRPLIAVLVC